MPTTLDLSGLDQTMAGLRKLGDPDAEDLMKHWTQVIDDDNRAGILAGLDKDGIPLIPVRYRPVVPRLLTKAQRGGMRANARKGAHQGFGPLATGLHGNLTSAEYRQLGGPPLAPRGQFSRVVTNLKPGYGREGKNWVALGIWDEVVDVRGRPFLRYHFDGATGGGRKRNVTLPRRDLRGVRPAGMAKALSALKAWAEGLLRQAFG